MPILFDNIIFELQRSGGISTYWAELIKRFSKEEFSHVFLESLRAKKNRARSEISLPSDSIEHNFFSSRASRYFPVPVSFSKSQIFFSSYYRIPTCRKSKVVITVHDFVYERFVSGWRKQIHSFQKKMAIERADAIICVSNSTKNDLLDFFPDIDKNSVHVIYNGVSDCFFPISDRDSKKSLLTEIGIKTHYILYIGSRAGYKNFSVVVHALRELPEFQLICVGGGQFSREELTLLKENLTNRFQHVFPSNSDLNILYNNAFCLLYPSSYEGFGIPIVEAMKAGCPVIATRTSSIPEVLGTAGLVMNEPSKDEILQAIKSLGDQSIRREQIYRGIENSKRFAWDTCFREHHQLMQSIS